MNQSESRQGQNTRRVKIFDSDQFNPQNCSKSWDKVRVTCQQLFSRSRQIGLCFIEFRTSTSGSVPVSTSTSGSMIKQKEISLLEKMKSKTTKSDVYNANQYSVTGNSYNCSKSQNITSEP